MPTNRQRAAHRVATNALASKKMISQISSRCPLIIITHLRATISPIRQRGMERNQHPHPPVVKKLRLRYRPDQNEMRVSTLDAETSPIFYSLETPVLERGTEKGCVRLLGKLFVALIQCLPLQSVFKIRGSLGSTVSFNNRRGDDFCRAHLRCCA